MFEEPTNLGFYTLNVPLEALKKSIPDSIRKDETRLNDYLLHGLKLGLEALAQADISLDTTEYIAAIQREFTAIQNSRLRR